MTMKQRAAEIQRKFDAGWRFSIDWPPGFRPQEPERKFHIPVLAAHMRKSAELQRASHPKHMRPVLSTPSGTPFNPAHRK